MQGIAASRSELLQLLGGQRSIREFRKMMLRDLVRPRSDNVLLVYSDSFDGLERVPPVIVTDSRASRDMIAWLSTYIGDLQPISAFVRIVEWDEWLEYLEPTCSVAPSMPSESLVAGLIIAEALTHWRDQVDVSSITATASHSTYSFVRARSVVCRSPISQRTRAELPNRWMAARTLLGNPVRGVPADPIERVWTSWEHATSPSNNLHSYSPVLSEAISQFIENGVLRLEIIDRMVGSNISGLLKEEELRGSRERRISVFSRCCELCLSLPDSVRRKPETSLVLAYIASRMSAGTFEYSRAVCARLVDFPEIVLWYGLLEGIAPNSRVHTAYGGLGTRLFRDVIVQREVVSRPACDISLAELAILVESGGFARSRLSRQGALQVELMPLVESTVRVGMPSDKEAQPERQREFSWSQSGLPRQVTDALEVLRRSIVSEMGLISGLNVSGERQPKTKKSKGKKDQ